MLKPLQTKGSLLDSALPQSPKPGDVFKLPAGQYGGGSFCVTIYHQTKCVGSAFNSANTVGGLLKLTCVSAHVPLTEGMVLSIVNVQKLYTHMRYDAVLGWVGHDRDSKVIGTQHLYVRVHLNQPVIISKDYYLYDTLYVRLLPQEDN